jgi:predicted nucleic acid-binding protein
MSVEFCDTNVFVYAYHPEVSFKQSQALGIVERLWESGEGALSVQILQEFFVVATRKLSLPMTHEVARDRVQSLTSWRLFAPAAGDVLEAIDTLPGGKSHSGTRCWSRPRKR